MGNGFLDEDGRKPRKRSQGSPRVGSSSAASSAQVPTIKLGRMAYGGSITTHLRRTMAQEKRASGRRTYRKTTTPSSGRYNARGRGRGILKTIPSRPGLYGTPWMREGGMGYAHAVETAPTTRASEARIGSVVEIGPTDAETGKGARLRLLSLQTLEAQLESNGATWLDKVQIGFDAQGLTRQGYGKQVRDAILKRRAWLIDYL